MFVSLHFIWPDGEGFSQRGTKNYSLEMCSYYTVLKKSTVKTNMAAVGSRPYSDSNQIIRYSNKPKLKVKGQTNVRDKY